MQTAIAAEAQSHRRHGDILRESGDWKGAIVSYKLAAEAGDDEAMEEVHALSSAAVALSASSDGRRLASLSSSVEQHLVALAESESAAGYVALAEALSSLSLHEEATISLLCALSLDSDFRPATEALETINLSVRSRAIDFRLRGTCQSLLPADHGYTRTHVAWMERFGLRLGHAFRDCGRMEGAIAAYAFAAEAAPTPDNFFHLGHAYRQSGRFKTAEETYRKAIDLAPQSAEAHFYLAEALEASRDLKGAMLAFEEADTLGLSAARDQWSRLLSKLQHLIFPAHSDAFSDAGAIMEALVRQENDETYLRLANALEAAGSFDAAIYACGAALTHRADYPEAERLVRDIVEQRVLKEKRSFLMQAGRRHVFPDACGFQSLATDILETLCLRVGHAFRDTGMPVPAFAAYDAAAVYSPSADTFYHLGHACRRLGDHRRAIRSYACGLEKGETAPGYFYLGEALIASGLQAEGLAALTWALSIDPSFVDARRHIDHLQRQIVPPMRVQDLVVPIPKPLSVGMDGGLATLATDAFCLQPAGSFAWLQKGDGEEQDGVTLATLGSSAPPDANAVPSLGKGGLALQFSLLAPMRSRHVVKILLRQPSSSRIDVFDRSLPAEEQQLPIRRLRANETLEWICFDLIKPVNGSPHFIELKVLDTLPPDGRGDCLALFTHPLGRNDLWGAFLEQVDYDRQLLELRRLLRV